MNCRFVVVTLTNTKASPTATDGKTTDEKKPTDGKTTDEKTEEKDEKPQLDNIQAEIVYASPLLFV